MSVNSMHSAVSLDNLYPTHTDDSSTVNNDTNDTVINGSYTDLRNNVRDTRLVRINFFIYSMIYI